MACDRQLCVVDLNVYSLGATDKSMHMLSNRHPPKLGTEVAAAQDQLSPGDRDLWFWDIGG